MKAVGYVTPTPRATPGALFDFEAERPRPGPRDLLIEVRAVSVNPVDTKVRASRAGAEGAPVVLGWDGAGVVAETGAEVTLFSPGDEVWFAGAIDRPGSNAQFTLVDERIVARKPPDLEFAEAAAMPLTALTAWEALFDSFRLRGDERGTLLVVGGAGGVGSMAIQLARQLTALTVVATASRPKTADWVRGLGAHEVIDHRRPLSEALQEAGFDGADYVLVTTQSGHHWPEATRAARPRGRLALIEGPSDFNLRLMTEKSLTVSWEYMFTRPVLRTADMIRQHEILTDVARMTADGRLRTTARENLGRINAEGLVRAHGLSESGAAVGKIVLEGW
jgi:NADPH2:quinone reductase